VIDFTPKAAENAVLCAKHKTAFICGVTGLEGGLEESLKKASKDIPVVFAANFSLGIAVLGALICQAKKQLGRGYDIEIMEIHHRNKKDSPSGTALYLGGLLEEEANVDIEGKRPEGGIGYSSLRGGDVIGEHQIMFLGKNENLILSHKAQDRNVFASGAVMAALWSVNQPAGFYSMTDVIKDRV
jgi:4-hydroxy-tetrahydrodipicolinate reductase